MPRWNLLLTWLLSDHMIRICCFVWFSGNFLEIGWSANLYLVYICWSNYLLVNFWHIWLIFSPKVMPLYQKFGKQVRLNFLANNVLWYEMYIYQSQVLKWIESLEIHIAHSKLFWNFLFIYKVLRPGNLHYFCLRIDCIIYRWFKHSWSKWK